MPAARRFFVNNQGLAKDLVLVDAEHNHLANVLRLRTDDEVIVVCGDEFDYYYEITEIKKSQTKLTFAKKQPNIHNPKHKLTVYMGVIKHDNLALAVEKLNEIGATELVLFKSAYSQNLPVKLDKLQTAAQQSCKQCGRSIPLEVSGVLTFDEFLKAIPKNTVFADEKEKSLKINSADAAIIGPEGGFTDAEREILRKIASPVSLGARILRAETAAIVGASLILSELGEI